MNLRLFFLSILLVAVFAVSSQAAPQQARDYFTAEEIELVKDAQILDKRIDVFIKAADRRVQALNGTVAASAKSSKKDSENWGGLPTGSRAELIGDIAGILDGAITNIDDVSMRDPTNPLIPKALRKLAAAATHIVEQLKPAEANATDDAELNNFDQLAESAQAIVDAANRLPPPSEKKSKNKSEKAKATN